MRIVRYSSQQRVDLPDITAMSYLVLGEFRRLTRGALMGPDALRVIRGFAVEPSSPASAIVNVVVDPGGGNPLSFAVGAENLGGGLLDEGQLLGGADSDGNVEGNASQPFDFTAQPAGTYSVQVRFVYTAGQNDNRAFWNQGTNTEFIAATDTRSLPTIEVGVSLGADTSLGAEYLRLANVVWNGATIDAADITDARTFAVEGSAAAFTGAAQDLTFGVGDFDRSADRGSIGVNEIYPALRALARQVQDIKGQSDAGSFDWYSRPYAAASDPTALLDGGSRTRSLRTVNVATFTVGDGTNTFGDFNGTSGLADCLAHIDALVTAGNSPLGIRIVLRVEDKGTVTPFTFELDETYDWSADSGSNPRSLEIIGIGTGITASGEPQTGVRIAGTDATITPGAQVAMVNTGSNRLRIENLVLLSNASDVPYFQGELRARNVYGSGTGLTAASVMPLRPRPGSIIEDAVFGLGLQRVDATGTGRVIFRSSSFTSAGMDLEDLDVVFEDCALSSSTASGTAVNPFGLTAFMTSVGTLELRGCEVNYEGSWDGLRMGAAGSDYTRLTLTDSVFTRSNSGDHTANAGANGVEGTGWSVHAWAELSPFAGTVAIRNCRFTNGGDVDSGEVRIKRAVDFVVDSSRFTGLTDGGVGLEVVGAASTTQLGGRITSNFFGAAGVGETETAMIRLDDTTALQIQGNNLDGRDSAGGAITRISGGGAIVTANSNADIIVTGNRIHDFEGVAAISGSGESQWTVADNQIINCTAALEFGGVCVGWAINGNTLTATGSDRCDVTFTSGSCTNFVVSGNYYAHGSAAGTAFDFSAGITNSVFVANRVSNGSINLTGVGNVNANNVVTP